MLVPISFVKIPHIIFSMSCGQNRAGVRRITKIDRQESLCILYNPPPYLQPGLIYSQIQSPKIGSQYTPSIVPPCSGKYIISYFIFRQNIVLPAITYYIGIQI